jgi:hypothetical protein
VAILDADGAERVEPADSTCHGPWNFVEADVGSP